MLWTRNKIIAILNRSDEAVERAIVGIYAIKPKDTNKKLGYSEKDYPLYSKLASIIILNPNDKPLGKRLSAKQINIARQGMKKYCYQLLHIANGANNG